MLRAIALLAAAVALPAVARADDKPFESKDGKFAAKFPSAPKEQSLDTAGTKLYLFVLEQKPGAFMVAYADLPIPEKETEKEIEARLDGSRDGMLKNMGGKLTDEKKVKLDGKHPGREIFADIGGGKGKVRARVYYAGTRLYQVLVVGEKEFVEAKGTVEFLDSLKLTK